MLVRCLDNSLHSDQLTVGRQYELESVESYDNIRLRGIDGLFHLNRFSGVPVNTLAEIREAYPGVEISDARFPEPIKRYRGKV
jgi:hypothetical protein